jgi:uncharacterized cupin superfamily protein
LEEKCAKIFNEKLIQVFAGESDMVITDPEEEKEDGGSFSVPKVTEMAHDVVTYGTKTICCLKENQGKSEKKHLESGPRRTKRRSTPPSSNSVQSTTSSAITKLTCNRKPSNQKRRNKILRQKISCSKATYS